MVSDRSCFSKLNMPGLHGNRGLILSVPMMHECHGSGAAFDPWRQFKVYFSTKARSIT